MYMHTVYVAAPVKADMDLIGLNQACPEQGGKWWKMVENSGNILLKFLSGKPR